MVRIQVYAYEEYRSANGFFDRRALTLEAEVESGDTGIQAIWDLQKQCDSALRSWLDLHAAPETEPPEDVPGPAPAMVEKPDTRPIAPFLPSGFRLWAVSPTRVTGYEVTTIKQLPGAVADKPWTLVEATSFADALSTLAAGTRVDTTEIDGVSYDYHTALPF